MIKNIEWCDFVKIKDYPKYLINKNGQVYSLRNNKYLKPIIKNTGYLYVFLYNNKGKKKKYIHLLVLNTFMGNKKINQEARHLDGNNQNNNINNLAWGTKNENIKDKYKHGTMPIGMKSKSHKLTEKNVIQIRQSYNKLTLRELAAKYNVSHTCIRRAAIGRTWSYLGD